MVHHYQVGKVFPYYPIFKKVLPAHLPHQMCVPCNALTKIIRDCSKLVTVVSVSGPPIARGRHSFSLSSLREGRGLKHCRFFLG